MSAIIILTMADRFICKKEKLKFESHSKTEKVSNYNQIVNSVRDNKSSLKQFIVGKSSAAKEETFKLERKFNFSLECPDITDNFYLSILDWSKNGIFCVGVNGKCYLMLKQKQKEITEIKRPIDTFITCTKFILQGQILVLGTKEGSLELYDAILHNQIREIQQNRERISCIEQLNKSVLVCGSLNKEKTLSMYDLKIKNCEVARFNKNKSQCCGLAKNETYLASGYNNGSIQLWDVRNLQKCILTLKNHHKKSAAKALAWCPWSSHILASGGGKNDGKIILWDSFINEVKSKYETYTQITNLTWKQSDHLLFSSHDNGQCYGWDLNREKIVEVLSEHQGRILQMCFNPKDKDELCTLGADEIILFWNTKLRNNSVDHFEEESNLKNQLHRVN